MTSQAEQSNVLPKESLDTVLRHYVTNVKPDNIRQPCTTLLNSVLSVQFLDKAGITQYDERKLLEPFSYYRDHHPGKGRRQSLLQAFNHHLKLSQDWVEGVASIIEDLHSSSLLIDDIQDNSPLRCGSPTARIMHGIASTINAGNYVYFLAMSKISKLADEFGGDQEKMGAIFIEEMLELHRGQGMEIWWREKHELPTLEQYIIMVERKTGGLLRLGVRLLQCHPQYSEGVDLVSMVGDIGTLYQIRDDYINLVSTSYVDEKGFAEDISEGKYSFPVIHSLTTAPDSGLAAILRQRRESAHVKQQAIDLIHKTGSLKFTATSLEQLQQQLYAKISMLGGNPKLERFLSELSVGDIGSALQLAGP